MRRGLWQCSRCRRFWIYNVEIQVTALDKICHGCGKRNRASLIRQPGRRGRTRKTNVWQRPSYMPIHAIEKERQNRMAMLAKPRKGFEKATERLVQKNPHNGETWKFNLDRGIWERA